MIVERAKTGEAEIHCGDEAGVRMQRLSARSQQRAARQDTAISDGEQSGESQVHEVEACHESQRTGNTGPWRSDKTTQPVGAYEKPFQNPKIHHATEQSSHEPTGLPN